MPYVADYTYNNKGSVAHVRNPQAFADGVVTAKGALRQDVVNHDHELAAHAIAVVEEAATM